MRTNTREELGRSTNQPPSTGPAAEVSAPAPAEIPMAWLRSCSLKVAPKIARLAAVRSAAPNPWIATDDKHVHIWRERTRNGSSGEYRNANEKDASTEALS